MKKIVCLLGLGVLLLSASQVFAYQVQESGGGLSGAGLSQDYGFSAVLDQSAPASAPSRMSLPPVPEPSSIAALVCGLGGLAWRRRRS